MASVAVTVPFDTGYRAQLEVLGPPEREHEEPDRGPDLVLLRAAEYLRLAVNQFDSLSEPDNQEYLRKLAKGSFVLDLEELIRQIHYASSGEDMYVPPHQEWFIPDVGDFFEDPAKEELELLEELTA